MRLSDEKLSSWLPLMWQPQRPNLPMSRISNRVISVCKDVCPDWWPLIAFGEVLAREFDASGMSPAGSSR